MKHFKNGISVPHLIHLADKLDAIGASAMADIVDETVLLLYAQQTPQQQIALQQQKKLQQQQLADRFVNIYNEMMNATRLFSSPSQIPIGMKHILDEIRELGLAANALKQSVKAETIQELIKLADKLDFAGKHILADIADHTANIVNKFENDPPIKPGHQTSLSTRYCPDHIGVQAVRISERIYQCPIDGRTYDYESGYSNYKGQRIPGGSIAAQTPMTAPYALPQMLFDTRQNVINTLN